MDPAGVFHAVDFAHDSCGGDCAVDYCDASTGVAREIRQASVNCAVDASAMVLCVGDRSDHLFYGVSNLCAEVRGRRASCSRRLPVHSSRNLFSKFPEEKNNESKCTRIFR